ncbi:PREDICTED: osteocalcin [Nipponia nippon]|uniref:osteocalcin n=1 Tax=Nipponia nippon TaxID=128390 RepID=UPI000511441A|nr:PREDICTED: osteocalcin [Nipponia nippon]
MPGKERALVPEAKIGQRGPVRRGKPRGFWQGTLLAHQQPRWDPAVGTGTDQSGAGERTADSSISADDSPSSEAFVSKRASAEVVRRHRRNYVYDSSVYGAVRNPLEAKREVCELNPDCDELADHIGFQEAYRRFYGTV